MTGSRHAPIPAFDSDDEEEDAHSQPLPRRRTHHSRDRAKIVNHLSPVALGFPEHQKIDSFIVQKNRVSSPRVVKSSAPLERETRETVNFYSGSPPQFYSLDNIKEEDKKGYTGIQNPNVTASDGLMKKGVKRIMSKADTLFKRKSQNVTEQPVQLAALENLLSEEESTRKRRNSRELEEYYNTHFADTFNDSNSEYVCKPIATLSLSLVEGRALSGIYDPSTTNSLRGDTTYLMYCDILVEGLKKRSKARLARRPLPNNNQQASVGIPTPVTKWNESYEFNLGSDDSTLYIEAFQLAASNHSGSGRKLSSGGRGKGDPVFSGYVSIPLTQFKHGNMIDGWYTLLSEMGEPTHGSLHLSIQVKEEEEEKEKETVSEVSVDDGVTPMTPIDLLTNRFEGDIALLQEKHISVQTKYRSKMRRMDQRLQALEVQLEKLSNVVRVLDQENLYLRTRITEHEDDVGSTNRRVSNLETHVDKLANKTEWRGEELIMYLCSFLLGFLSVIIVLLKRLGLSGTLEPFHQKVIEKQAKIASLAKHKFTVLTITPVAGRVANNVGDGDSDQSFESCAQEPSSPSSYAVPYADSEEEK